MTTEEASNLYQVLGIFRSDYKTYPSVPFSEIKQGYHAALLENHPDKRRQGRLSIAVIKSAFATLGDTAARAEYDRKLVQKGRMSAPRALATGVVDLSEMTEEEPGADGDDEYKWTRECRCGEDGGYVLKESDLEANGDATSIVVQCSGCSLWIEVQYDIEEE